MMDKGDVSPVRRTHHWEPPSSPLLSNASPSSLPSGPFDASPATNRVQQGGPSNAKRALFPNSISSTQASPQDAPPDTIEARRSRLMMSEMPRSPQELVPAMLRAHQEIEATVFVGARSRDRFEFFNRSASSAGTWLSTSERSSSGSSFCPTARAASCSELTNSALSPLCEPQRVAGRSLEGSTSPESSSPPLLVHDGGKMMCNADLPSEEPMWNTHVRTAHCLDSIVANSGEWVEEDFVEDDKQKQRVELSGLIDVLKHDARELREISALFAQSNTDSVDIRSILQSTAKGVATLERKVMQHRKELMHSRRGTEQEHGTWAHVEEDEQPKDVHMRNDRLSTHTVRQRSPGTVSFAKSETCISRGDGSPIYSIGHVDKNCTPRKNHVRIVGEPRVMQGASVRAQAHQSSESACRPSTSTMMGARKVSEKAAMLSPSGERKKILQNNGMSPDKDEGHMTGIMKERKNVGKVGVTGSSSSSSSAGSKARKAASSDQSWFAGEMHEREVNPHSPGNESVADDSTPSRTHPARPDGSKSHSVHGMYASSPSPAKQPLRNASTPRDSPCVDLEEMEDRLRGYYAKYNPAKIDSAGRVVRMFAGRLGALRALLRSKYGHNLSVSVDRNARKNAAFSSEAREANSELVKDRMVLLYASVFGGENVVMSTHHSITSPYHSSHLKPLPSASSTLSGMKGKPSSAGGTPRKSVPLGEDAGWQDSVWPFEHVKCDFTAEEALAWRPNQVYDLLVSCEEGLADLASFLRRKGVTGAKLVDFNTSSLQLEFGVTSVLERVCLMRIVEALRGRLGLNII